MPGPSRFHVFLAATGAVVPPAVLEGGLPELDLEDFPPGTEPVRLEVGGGATLAGVFVPADPGAPVVLHLLASEASITFGVHGLAGFPLLWQLRDRGLASLAVDWRGVGASSGARSPRHLPEDARAAWEEALRRAGGDPGRVILRGMSLGTLAAASLLEACASPAAVVLVAPVRAETVVRNWARHYYPPYLTRLARLLRPAVSVDLVEALRRVRCPLLVYAPRDDYLLPGWERLLVEEAVAAAGGRWACSRFGHPANVLNAHRLTAPERDFYARVLPRLQPRRRRLAAVLQAIGPARADADFPEGSAARARLEELCSWYLLDPPALTAVVARRLARHQEEAPVLDWLRTLPPGRLAGVPVEALDALLELEDPAGRILTRELRVTARYLRELAASGQAVAEPESLATLAGELGAERSVRTLPRTETLPGGWAVARPGTAPAALRRRCLRLLLKGAGIPDRLTPRGLECWRDGRWTPLAG